jgi:CBS domain-containing membrane protein
MIKIRISEDRFSDKIKTKTKYQKKKKKKKTSWYYIKHTYIHIRNTFKKRFKWIPSPLVLFKNFIFLFIIMIVFALVEKYLLIEKKWLFLIRSFSSTAAVIIIATESPFSQPVNCLFGHLLSGIVGVTCFQIFGIKYNFLAGPIAISTASLFMQIIGIFHFPAVATALSSSYFYEDQLISQLGYLFLIFPICKFFQLIKVTGITTIIVISAILNNLIWKWYPNTLKDFINFLKKRIQNLRLKKKEKVEIFEKRNYFKELIEYFLKLFRKRFKKIRSPLLYIKNYVFIFIVMIFITTFENFYLIDKNLILFVTSFGTTIAGLIITPESPLSQPYNIIVGNLISSIIGITCFKIFGVEFNYLSISFSVSLSAVFMQLTNSLHFPAFSTAVSVSFFYHTSIISDLGYLFILFPVCKFILFIISDRVDFDINFGIYFE